MATDEVVWYHATVDLLASGWTLTLETWTDGGTEATTLGSAQTSVLLPYMVSPAPKDVSRLRLYQSAGSYSFWSNVLATGELMPNATVFVVR